MGNKWGRQGSAASRRRQELSWPKQVQGEGEHHDSLRGVLTKGGEEGRAREDHRGYEKNGLIRGIRSVQQAHRPNARTKAKKEIARQPTSSIFPHLNDTPAHLHKSLAILVGRRGDAHVAMLEDKIPQGDEQRHELRLDLVLGPEKVQDGGAKDIFAVGRRDACPPGRRRRRDRGRGGRHHGRVGS